MENIKVIRSFATSLGILSLCLLSMPCFIGCDTLTTDDSNVETAMRLYEQRKFAEAIPRFENALEKRSIVYTRSEVLTTIGNCYYELDQFAESLEYHDRAIEEDPKNHQAYVNKGVTYRIMGEFDKAAQMYATALEIAPDYAELHASTGALAIFQGDYPAAVKHLERSIELETRADGREGFKFENPNAVGG